MRKDNCVHVIDENASARTGIVRLLKAAGYNVKSYEYAADFLHGYHSGDSGCIVMDAYMTGISGEDLMSEFAIRGLDLPVIVTYSTDDEAVKRLSWVSGASYFFRKPVDGKALIDAIDWVFDSSSKKKAT
jgi:FixJ family two-component response regulator